ncbi:MAG: DMT family transporter [Taibaiella sp.]|nr:DMT family transporter [Taibaiella sp.]
MFYLIATILLNVVISAIFKVFPRFKIDALQAIVVNYCVCVVTGSLFIGRLPFRASAVGEPWFLWALLMGASFISIFNLIAYCTRTDGITTTTIANKLSLVIPVVFSVFLFHEPFGWGKAAGVLLAFPAVYLTTRVKEDNGKMQRLFFPVLLFVGSGLLDTVVNYVQHNLLAGDELQATFTIYCFAVAGVIGILFLSIMVMMGKVQLHARNIIAGICVGIPNYFSIYFLIRALNSNLLTSSAAIPVINIGVLVASTVTALIVFREKVNAQRIIGLVLSIVAILLITYAELKK